MSIERLFCYGSLESSALVYALTQRRFEQERIVLKGFRRSGLYGEAFPAVFRSNAHAVTGTVFERLNKYDLGRLDRYEGSLYRRQRVSFYHDGVQRVAWIYALKPALKHRLRPEDWNKIGFFSRYFRFSVFRVFGRSMSFFLGSKTNCKEVQHGQI